jgi:RNA polymerase sigma-70 factor, ECF subfamily
VASPFPEEHALTVARFESAALPFMDSLYRKALHLTRRPEDARDLVQETYLRAFRRFSSFAEGTNCKAWLFTIQYSIFVNKYRKARRAPTLVPLDELNAAVAEALANDNWESEFAALDWQEAEVASALGQLPEDFCSAVLLVDVEQLSYEETAQVLGCPVGTVRSRLARGRRLLFLALHDYARARGFLRRDQD